MPIPTRSGAVRQTAARAESSTEDRIRISNLMLPRRHDLNLNSEWRSFHMAATAGPASAVLPASRAQRNRRRACRGTSPNLPEWKSRNACSISAWLFMTKGPPIATGWRIG